METQTLVPMAKAMRVVGLLKQEIAARKRGYAISEKGYWDLHADFVYTLNKLREVLENDDHETALEIVAEKLNEYD
jgi:hypothetical protein